MLAYVNYEFTFTDIDVYCIEVNYVGICLYEFTIYDIEVYCIEVNYVGIY